MWAMRKEALIKTILLAYTVQSSCSHKVVLLVLVADLTLTFPPGLCDFFHVSP